jgi:hydroxymethylbilane synthase
LRKLEEGVADATFLACAGLNRLGLAKHITQKMPTSVMLPAVAQGAIGIETRADDAETARLLAPLNDPNTATCIAAERAYLAQLEGSCRTPIAGLAELRDGNVYLRAEILSTNGTHVQALAGTARAADAVRLGEKIAAEILERAGPDFFATT